MAYPALLCALQIGFRTDITNALFDTILELQPREGADAEGGQSPQGVVEQVLQVRRAHVPSVVGYPIHSTPFSFSPFAPYPPVSGLYRT